jgi:hypothetical protein
VLECSHDGDTRGVDQSTVVVDDVYVCAQGEAFDTCDNAQGLGVESVRAADGLFQYSRQNNFSIGRPAWGQLYALSLSPQPTASQYVPANLKCWRGHWRELCDDLEDAIELALGQWCRHIDGDARNNSCDY